MLEVHVGLDILLWWGMPNHCLLLLLLVNGFRLADGLLCDMNLLLHLLLNLLLNMLDLLHLLYLLNVLYLLYMLYWLNMLHLLNLLNLLCFYWLWSGMMLNDGRFDHCGLCLDRHLVHNRSWLIGVVELNVARTQAN